VARRILTTRKKCLLQRLMPNPMARRRETRIKTQILRRRRLEEEDIENEDEPNDTSQIRTTLQALNFPNMWIGDTGATKHSTKHRQGGINARPSSSRTRGIYGQAITPDSEVDLPGIYCDKDGDEQFTVKLRNVDVTPESHYNLISLTRLMEERHMIKESKKNGITACKGNHEIKFNIRVETPKGVLWCAYIKRHDPKNEVATEANDVVSDNPTVSLLRFL